MVFTADNSKSVTLPVSTASNLEEAARHYEAHGDGEVDRPIVQTVEMLTRWYIEQYPDDFDSKGDGQAVYVGGD